jgi:glutamate decarboxylase
MLANLYHAPDASKDNSWGSATIGSSEAIMLAVLAMKKKWEAKRKQENKPFDNPNIVYGANVQVCWEKVRKQFWRLDPNRSSFYPCCESYFLKIGYQEVVLMQAGRYFDVEERMVKLTPEHFILTPEGAEKLCDENTIGEPQQPDNVQFGCRCFAHADNGLLQSPICYRHLNSH